MGAWVWVEEPVGACDGVEAELLLGEELNDCVALGLAVCVRVAESG